MQNAKRRVQNGKLTLGLIVPLVYAMGAGFARAEIYVGFEDTRPALGPESFFNGSQRYHATNPPLPANEDGVFTSGDLQFHNHYHADPGQGVGYWDGFAYSNVTDATTPGFENQYAAIAGSGVDESPTYAVAYEGIAFLGGRTPTISGVPGDDLLGAYFTNTTYAYWTMKEGNAFAKRFGGAGGNDRDYFQLEITGKKEDGSPAGTVDFYLADFRFADNSQDYILDDWTFVDLSEFDQPNVLEFRLTSSDNDPLWGMNTPAYFAIDNITLAGTAEASLTWDGEGGGAWNSSTQWLGGVEGDLPNADTHATVRIDEVQVAVPLPGESAEALSLSIEEAGQLLVAADATLSVAGETNVADGTLSIGPGGTLDVGGRFEIGEPSRYVSRFTDDAHGAVTVAGDVQLGGTLSVQPVGVGDRRGEVSHTILSADGQIDGRFDTVPPIHVPGKGPAGHLGLGVFNRGVEYVEGETLGVVDAVEIGLFVAEGGDGNGDGNVDGQDITSLIIHFSLPGDPADRTWLDNDTAGGPLGRGDGIVDGQDITDLITHFTRADPGPTATASVPEPSTTAMFPAAMLTTGLATWMRRRRKRVHDVAA